MVSRVSSKENIREKSSPRINGFMARKRDLQRKFCLSHIVSYPATVIHESNTFYCDITTTTYDYEETIVIWYPKKRGQTVAAAFCFKNWDLTAEKQFITQTIIKLLFFLGRHLRPSTIWTQKTNPTVNYKDIKKDFRSAVVAKKCFSFQNKSIGNSYKGNIEFRFFWLFLKFYRNRLRNRCPHRIGRN